MDRATRKNRGRLLGTASAMQGFGLLAGPAVAAILISGGVSHGLALRLMLAFGNTYAASVVYLRRKIRETPRHTLAIEGNSANGGYGPLDDWAEAGHLGKRKIA